jgi:hypothetical protein
VEENDEKERKKKKANMIKALIWRLQIAIFS